MTDSESVWEIWNMRMWFMKQIKIPFHDFRAIIRKRALGVSQRPECGIRSGTGCCFTGFTCHPVDAPAHDCNHNYADRNCHAASSHTHEITGSVRCFLSAASTSPRLIQRTAGSPAFAEAFPVSEHPPDKGVVIGKKGEHQTMSVYGKASTGKWTCAITRVSSRCRVLHHAFPIIVASEDGSLNSSELHPVYLCWAVISRYRFCHTSSPNSPAPEITQAGCCTRLKTRLFPLVSLNFGFQGCEKREITAESGSGSIGWWQAFLRGNVNPPGLTRRHGVALWHCWRILSKRDNQ